MSYSGTDDMSSKRDVLLWDVHCLFNFTAPSPQVMTRSLEIYRYLKENSHCWQSSHASEWHPCMHIQAVPSTLGEMETLAGAAAEGFHWPAGGEVLLQGLHPPERPSGAHRGSPRPSDFDAPLYLIRSHMSISVEEMSLCPPWSSLKWDHGNSPSATIMVLQFQCALE